jgi:3-polyprenyl-4-hydroxybenzoate decarboxylase
MLFLDQDLSAKVASGSVVRGCGLVPWHAASRSDVSHGGEVEVVIKASKALLRYRILVVA